MCARNRFDFDALLNQTVIQHHQRTSILVLAVAEYPDRVPECAIPTRIGGVTKKENSVDEVGSMSLRVTRYGEYSYLSVSDGDGLSVMKRRRNLYPGWSTATPFDKIFFSLESHNFCPRKNLNGPGVVAVTVRNQDGFYGVRREIAAG